MASSNPRKDVIRISFHRHTQFIYINRENLFITLNHSIATAVHENVLSHLFCESFTDVPGCSNVRTYGKRKCCTENQRLSMPNKNRCMQQQNIRSRILTAGFLSQERICSCYSSTFQSFGINFSIGRPYPIAVSVILTLQSITKHFGVPYKYKGSCNTVCKKSGLLPLPLPVLVK